MIGEENTSLKDNSEFSKRAGGAPANVAVAASRLGAEADMVASVGDDEFGDFLIEKMKKEDIGVELIEKKDEKTTLAFASLDEDSKPHFSFYRGADEKIDAEQLSELQADIVHVGSLPFTDDETAENLIDFLRYTEKPISFDPNLRDELLESYGEYLREVVNLTDILFIADEELEFFGGLESLKKQVEKLIITRGSEGAEMHVGDQEIKAEPIDVDTVDTTGAGDALTGAYLAFSHLNEEEALQKAVEAAGISTTKKGAMAALPRKPDLQ